MTVEEAFALGKRTGREELLREIQALLGVDAAITAAVTAHEEQSGHGVG